MIHERDMKVHYIHTLNESYMIHMKFYLIGRTGIAFYGEMQCC